MSDTKRYRVCETCNKKGELRGPKGGKCPDCGHGDCAPCVVDAGVVWSREWPDVGWSWAWHPSHMPIPQLVLMSTDVRDEACFYYDERGSDARAYQHDSSEREPHLWRFAPLTIPAPPKE